MQAVLGLFGSILFLIVICGGLYGCPQYNVYEQRLSGEAELARAEYSRQVAVREAQAKKDSATLLAEAEVARAQGVAQANKIIGDSLGGERGAAYLRYLWVDKLSSDKERTVIYIPTEANLPSMLEAGRSAATPPKAP